MCQHIDLFSLFTLTHACTKMYMKRKSRKISGNCGVMCLCDAWFNRSTAIFEPKKTKTDLSMNATHWNWKKARFLLFKWNLPEWSKVNAHKHKNDMMWSIYIHRSHFGWCWRKKIAMRQLYNAKQGQHHTERKKKWQMKHEKKNAIDWHWRRN